MIANDPVLTTDPFDSLCTTLSTNFMQQVPSLKYVIQGWPDPKWFEDTGVNFPSVFFVKISEKATNLTSRNLVYKSVQNANGTFNVYYERQRIEFLLQISLFTTDPQARLNIGHTIKQYLINTIQIPVNVVDTAKFIYTGNDHIHPGRDNFYQRDMDFRVSMRVLDGEVVNPNKTISSNANVGDQSLSQSANPTNQQNSSITK